MGRRKAPRSSKKLASGPLKAVETPKLALKRSTASEKKRSLLKKLGDEHQQRKRDKESGKLQLESMFSALDGVNTQVTPKKKTTMEDKRVSSRKGRKHTLEKEVATMSAVLSDHQYTTDPFATLLLHAKSRALANQPPAAEPQSDGDDDME